MFDYFYIHMGGSRILNSINIWVQYIGDLGDWNGIRYTTIHTHVCASEINIRLTDISLLASTHINQFACICHHVIYSYIHFWTLKGCLKTCYQKNVIDTCDCGDSSYSLSAEALTNTTVQVCNTAKEKGRIAWTIRWLFTYWLYVNENKILWYWMPI